MEKNMKKNINIYILSYIYIFSYNMYIFSYIYTYITESLCYIPETNTAL